MATLINMFLRWTKGSLTLYRSCFLGTMHNTQMKFQIHPLLKEVLYLNLRLVYGNVCSNLFYCVETILIGMSS